MGDQRGRLVLLHLSLQPHGPSRGLVPVGLDRQGLPIGLQIVGSLDGEGAILRVAGALERLRPIAPPQLA